ncbi:hypothetical protein WA577_006335 [Blastocystis sp. JDR]
MKSLALFVMLLSAALSTLVCQQGQVYVAVTKKCMNWGYEESYTILNGGTTLVTSAEFANYEQRTDEYCLPATTNNQYSFNITDTYGDSWTSGSWVSIAGIYGNVFFKNYMTEKRDELFPLSLYYPIMKNQQWKMFSSTSSIASDWFAVNFSDGNWQQVTLGSVTTPATGTQYFRKQFAGITGMAAYEARFNYRYGIIAYMNGVEIFRDHMGEGAVTAGTGSTGAYDAYEYHGVIRPAGEAESTNNVLAVELHFANPGSENAVEFDAFVASIAPSIQASENTKCFIYPYETTITATGGTSPTYIFDFTKGNSYSAASTVLPATVNYELTGSRAHINGLRVWPYTSYSSAPGTFTWQGAMSSSSSYSNVISISGATYESSIYQTFYGYFNAKPYQSYRLTVTAAAASTTMYAYEVQPVTCHDLLPSGLEFSPNSYSIYANYEEVTIRPVVNEFTGCTVNPTLPAGLTMNPSTCTISGKPTVSISSTTFTVSSTMAGQQYQGTFTLQVLSCSGTLLKVLRTYKTNGYYESFNIKEKASQQILLNMAYNSGQPNSEDRTYIICATGSIYVVTLGSSINYWQSASFLYVNAVLSGDEYETIARLRYDSYQGLPEDRNINAQWAVGPSQSWQYKMGDVPANWQTEAGWQTASMGSFPASTNTIQLYKSTFNVDSLDIVAGFVISLRYVYGCIIYMNNVEVFRNGVTGDLSTSSIATNNYNNILYHQISLPVKTMAIGDQPAVNYLQQGSNTIAIAIVAQSASQTNSMFDCAVRLMGAPEASRVFDYSIDYSGLYGSPSSILNQYYANTIYYYSCDPNYLHVSFSNDRREWISSVTLYLHYEQNEDQPTQFILKARNTNMEEWTTIKTVTGLTWSLKGEHKKIWLENNKPYNQYRFENFASGNAASCDWELSTVDMIADATAITVPELSYSTPLIINKDIEMGEVYPNSNYYYDFTVNPALPTGVTIDPNSGKISGTAHVAVAAATYQITAKKFGGGSSTAVLTISVEICTGGKGLVTMVVRMDSWPAEGSYKLFKGRGTSGEMVASNSGFAVANGLNYGDFCLSHDIYTLQLSDSLSDGWNNPAGYYLTVDVGEMVIETGQMPRSVASISTSFTSNIPFQIEYDDWKVFNSPETVAENWNAIDFDDSAWTVTKAANMGEHMTTTAYIRREVNIPNLEDYHVLNARVKYAGGVVVYFNGNIVARFNLEDEYDASTEATTVHDSTAFSKFHVILPTVGAVAGKNVIAFEIHRASGQSTIVFDATGIFAVNDCSVAVDSFSAIDASTVTTCTKEDLLDLNPTTYGYIPNSVGSFLAWTVENLEGSKFNSFGLLTNVAVTGYGFTVKGRWDTNEEYTNAMSQTGQATKAQDRVSWDMPVGIAGFRQFRFEVDSVASAIVSTNAYIMLYCKPSGSGSCPAVGNYPSVGEGQISPAKCAEGYRGYSYRECVNGQLGDVKNDKCEYKLPARLQYDNNNMEFVMNTEVSSGLPNYRNIIEEFYMQDSTPLPEGLTIDAKTGEITGKPIALMDSKAFTVRAKNPAGETFTVITITVRKGHCQPEGVFERTPVGEIAVYQCSMQGSYVGTQKRACILGKKDGEWQKASGFCMPVMAIVLLVVVVIIIIAVVVFLLMRTTRSAKAVGGVKGKSGKSAKKTATKKPSAKAVKV